MNPDVNQLRQFGQELAPPRDQPPDDLRRRVLAPSPSPRPLRRRGYALRWRLSAAAVVAAAVALFLLVLPSVPLGSLARGVDHARPARTAQQLLQQAASRAAL